MVTMIISRWDGITPEQYDALRDVVGWDRDVPDGMHFHVASFKDGILRMADVWDTEVQFGTFGQTRIVPGLRTLGITGLPEVITAPVRDLTDVRATTA